MNQQELSNALRKEVIKNGHAVQTIASGYSMFPFLRKGDTLTIEPVPMNNIKRGDVVVFESEEKWIAHRVIKIRNNTKGLEFLLRGDTCFQFDPVVDHENYIGSVSVFTRNNSKKTLSKGVFFVWKKSIVALGMLYTLPLYCTRIFAGLILYPFLKRRSIV
jgi:signal peptidase I